MNIVELKKSLDSGELSNLYIFTGEEYTILNIYIDRICDLFDVVKRSDSVLSIYKNLSSRSLIQTGKQVYVVRDDRDFLTSETIWIDIVKRLKARNATLVLKYSSIDTRSKFNKHFNDLHLIVLDDVLTTVDETHKDKIARLLLEEFNDYQFIITAHNKEWVDELERLCLD